MTTYPIEETRDDIGVKKAVKLIGVGKKYPFEKNKDNEANNLIDLWALKDTSLEVKEGEILGIIGRNGAGKTTLLNILTGVLSPTEGKVCVEGKALGLFNLGIGFQDELTGKENIFLNGTILGGTRKELENKLNLIIEFSELGEFINMPLGTYSQGMRLRLAFSIIANLDFDTIVIDEILAVGDALFQHKCFQRLMDFKRAGKTLIITTQSMDLIERLCDRVVLIDHGHLLFDGDIIEGINKYRALLNTEKFFVGPEKKEVELFENTKKWADDISEWGKIFGTKEVLIESVDFINKFGLKTNKIKSSDPLKIKVHFNVRNAVKEPHFGVAIFRNDGVYCYGPNTVFDKHKISELKKGKGYFILNYKNIFLAPGEYRISVAIWDKKETLAFDYRVGFYKLNINGKQNIGNELLKIPFRTHPNRSISFPENNDDNPDLSFLNDKWGRYFETEGVKIQSVKLLDSSGVQKEVFMTNDSVELRIGLSEFKIEYREHYFWIGLYRDDGIYCQGILLPIKKERNFSVFFPKLAFLPGNYKISVGIWDILAEKFLLYHHAIYPFRMIFGRQDHGTVYLEHKWKWKIKK